jgi:fatty acid desaturase
MTPTPLDLSPGAIRRRFPEVFVARPSIYWADFLGSAAVGWGAFVASGLVASPVASAAALAVAVLGLYRAVLFIHELTHLRTGAVSGFAAVWNLLVGFPLMVPSIMYVGSHPDHHKRSVYGTALDPEYEPMAYWSPLRIIASTLLMLVVPAGVALRWGVVGPLSRLVPPTRPFVVRHLSTLVINASYRRPAPRGRLARRWRLEETGAGIAFWLAAAGLATGTVGLDWLVRWYAAVTGILLLNHVRTLAAHRYESHGGPTDTLAQLLDTWNVEGVAWLTALLAPVGLRYHALHHLVPSVPYHHLGRLHRALVAGLPADSPYRTTRARGLLRAVRELLATAAENRRNGAGAEVRVAFRRGEFSAVRAAGAAAARSEGRIASGAGAAAR